VRRGLAQSRVDRDLGWREHAFDPQIEEQVVREIQVETQTDAASERGIFDGQPVEVTARVRDQSAGAQQEVWLEAGERHDEDHVRGDGLHAE
jgi:hypothetical protein